MRRSELWILFALSLAVRLLYVADIRGTVTFESPLVDAHAYDQTARQIAEEGLSALELPFYQPPLYPILLGGVYALTDGSHTAPRILHALLGAATAALVALLAGGAGGRLAGWVAGALFALYGPVLYLEGELLPPALVLALTTAALVFLVRADRPGGSTRDLVLAGLLLGFAGAARPTGLLLAGGAIVWWLAGGAGGLRGARGRLGSAGALAAAVVLPILPFTLANRIDGGETLLISHNGGINFYLGNGARSDSLTAIQPGYHWDRLQVEPWRAGARSRGEESRYWIRRGIREAGEAPGAWLAALGRKAIRLTDVRETPRNTDYEAFRPESRILTLPLPHFGWVLPLAALGVLLGFGPSPGRRARRLRSLLLLILAAVAIQNLLFFVAGRYRLEAVPALCVLAGLGVRGAWATAHARGVRRGVIGAFGVAAAVGTLAWVDFLGEREVDQARAAINRAVALRRAGLRASSTREARSALRHDPGDVDAHLVLAENLIAGDDLGEAVVHLDAAIDGAPDYLKALLKKARCLEELDRGDEAGPVYLRAIEADPYSADARLGYGVWLAIRGRHGEAREQFEVGLRIDPAHRELAHNLRNLERHRRGS